jgi:ATP-dependent Clp protease ATP-binding subunit ClpB
MTSNFGADIIQRNFADVTERTKFAVMETTKLEVMELLKKSVRPEFLNRIDDIILFTPLMQDEIAEIVRVQLKQLEKMLAKNHIKIGFTEEVVQQLAEEGFDPQFGARPLKRVIQKDIVNELSKKILGGQVNSESEIMVSKGRGGEFIFENVAGKKEKAKA